MGVGKTTVGLALANQLGWPLSDSDAAITERHGATVRELQLRLGTDGMHRLESEHLLDARCGAGTSSWSGCAVRPICSPGASPAGPIGRFSPPTPRPSSEPSRRRAAAAS